MIAELLALSLLVQNKMPRPNIDCRPAAVVIDQALSHKWTNFRQLTGEAVTIAVEMYNDLEPKTQIPWTSAWLVDAPEGVAKQPWGSIAVGFGDTICDKMFVPPDRWNQVVNLLDRGA